MYPNLCVTSSCAHHLLSKASSSSSAGCASSCWTAAASTWPAWLAPAAAAPANPAGLWLVHSSSSSSQALTRTQNAVACSSGHLHVCTLLLCRQQQSGVPLFPDSLHCSPAAFTAGRENSYGAELGCQSHSQGIHCRSWLAVCLAAGRFAILLLLGSPASCRGVARPAGPRRQDRAYQAAGCGRRCVYSLVQLRDSERPAICPVRVLMIPHHKIAMQQGVRRNKTLSCSDHMP